MDAHSSKNFLSYSGVKLPLNLVGPLESGEEDNRNTYYRAFYNEQGKLIKCQKLVYGEVEIEHRYCYHDNGAIKQAEIVEIDEEPNIIAYDESGTPQA